MSLERTQTKGISMPEKRHGFKHEPLRYITSCAVLIAILAIFKIVEIVSNFRTARKTKRLQEKITQLVYPPRTLL